MKIAITGSDKISNYEFMEKLCINIISKEQYYREVPTWKIEFVSGDSPKGIDHSCRKFVNKHTKSDPNIFVANWRDMDEQPSFPRTDYFGLMNASAGYNRNTRLVDYLSEGEDVVIAFDGEDKPTKDIIRKSKKYKIKTYQIKCENIEEVKIKIYNGAKNETFVLPTEL